MDAATIATLIGAAAAVGALVWAMIGNPDLRKRFRNRVFRSGREDRPAQRKLVRIEWKHLDDAIDRFLHENNTRYDLVVGLHPDGVSIANRLAAGLNARFASIEKVYPGMRRSPFFVFEDSSQARSQRESTSEFYAPSELPNEARILVVDGVTTFGNALALAGRRIAEALPQATVDYYVYAADEARLHASQSSLARRVRFEISIDNYRTWLQFPWDSK
jgi:hypothetical protein